MCPAIIEMTHVRSGKRLTNIRFFQPFITGLSLMEPYRAIGQHLPTLQNLPQLQKIQLKGRPESKRKVLKAQLPRDATVLCFDYNTAENSGGSDISGAREFGSVYSCLECLGSEYRADWELPELTPEDFRH